MGLVNDNDVVAEELAQHFVLHRHVRPGADVIAAFWSSNPNFFALTKYDPNGNMLWNTNLTQALAIPWGTVGDMTLDSAGNAYVTAVTSFDGPTVVAKILGTNGTVGWHEQYGTAGTTSGAASAVDASGNVYITGSYYGTVNFNPGPGTYNLTSYGSKKAGYATDVYVLKLNASGGFVWAGSIGTDNGTTAGGIAVDGSGNVFLTGQYSAASKQNDFNPGSGVYALPGSRAYLEKLDTNGNFQWAKGVGNFGHTAGDGTPIAVDGSGNVYITGQINESPFVEKLDTLGNVVWDAVATTTYDAYFSVAVDSLGDVYAVGYLSGTTNFDPNGGTYDLSPTTPGVTSSFVWKLTQS